MRDTNAPKKGSTNILTMVFDIILIFVIGFVAYTRLINPPGTVIYSSHGFDVSTNHYMKIEKQCQKGKISLSFVSNRAVNVFIMSESEFYSYKNVYYGGALAASNAGHSGTISCRISDSQKLYFVVENIGYYYYYY